MLQYEIFVIDIVADEDLTVPFKLGVSHGVIGKHFRVTLFLYLVYQRFVAPWTLWMIGNKGIDLTGIKLFGLGE